MLSTSMKPEVRDERDSNIIPYRKVTEERLLVFHGFVLCRAQSSSHMYHFCTYKKGLLDTCLTLCLGESDGVLDICVTP